ncbi:MAG: hypothetical protein F4X02_13430 [Chloroflexi bacterium]|nr:hypothetical protein [Chloroflexota bacterium]
MMRVNVIKTVLVVVVLSIAFLLVAFPGVAGDTLLSNNIGDGNAVFYIEGEPSVVINGFDLTPLGVTLPVALDAVSIAVETPVPGSAIDLLVYQDANGGSPIDSTLVYRETVALEQAGVNRIALGTPVIITAPVVWVGFNLPVDFRFYADTSGPSVLTYWAWTTGGTFDLTALSSAEALGPGDGSEPINIAMNGIARISAELRLAAYQEVSESAPLGEQIYTDVAQDTSIMRPYNRCVNLFFDPEDIEISADSSFTLDCEVQDEFHAPSPLQQPRNQELELLRIGALYKLSAVIPRELHAPGAVSTLPVPVTHCMRVADGDLALAVIGEIRAQGAPNPGPEKWNILPTVRFNNLVCAEVTVANYLAYFIPQTADSPENVNLVVGWTKVNPHPLYCGMDVSVRAPIVNTGQDWFDTNDSHVTITVQDIHVPSTIVTAERRFNIGASQLGPGARQLYEVGPLVVDTYVNDLHRLQVTIDHDGEVDEINETDNTWISEYVLVYAPGYDECGPYPKQTNLVWDLSNRCELSLRISSDFGLNVRRRLQQFEEYVIDIHGPEQTNRIDLLPSESLLRADYATEDTTVTDRGEHAYIRENRIRYRNQLADIWGTDWEHITSQVEEALRRRAECRGQS